MFRSEYWINSLVMTVATPDSAWDGFPAESDRVLLLAYNDNFVSQEIKDWWAQAAIDFDTVDYQVADCTKGDNGFLNSRADSMMKDNVNHPKFLWDDQYSILTENPNFLNYTSDFVEMIKWARTAWGQQVGELVNKHLEAGIHEVVFNSDGLPSGTLFYQMEYRDVRLTRQLFIMK